MWQGIFRTAAATLAYGLVHSVLAGDSTKRRVRAAVGDRNFDGLYRGFYMAQSTLGLVALAAYVGRQPNRELYRARGPAAAALRAGQLAGLAYMGWAQWHIGPLRFSGLDSLAAYLAGAPEIPPAAVGQGPSARADGSMHVAGPFRQSRHPLNLACPVVLWLNPRMTTNLATFNAICTAHFFFGSAREEIHLRNAHGAAYRAYQRSGVPYYLPRLGGAPPATLSSDAPLL